MPLQLHRYQHMTAAETIQKDGIEDGICDKCLREAADIFQLTGEYCLMCWQVMTHSNV